MLLEPKVSIIGGGLSAIYAYWGAIDAGYKPTEIQVLHNDISKPVGAVFMYESPIPWPNKKVASVLLGSCDIYSINQWGDIHTTSAHKRFSNGDKTKVVERLYLPDEMMTTLWGLIPRKAECPLLNDADFHNLKKKRDAVICTFGNADKRSEYKEKGFLETFPIHSNRSENHDYVIIYNGTAHVPWIRQTVTPGWIHTEYAAGTNTEHILYYEAERGNRNGKLTMAPDFHPDTPPLVWEERIEGNLFRVGRFSSYISGYLSHMARAETRRFLANL